MTPANLPHMLSLSLSRPPLSLFLSPDRHIKECIILSALAADQHWLAQ